MSAPFLLLLPFVDVFKGGLSALFCRTCCACPEVMALFAIYLIYGYLPELDYY